MSKILSINGENYVLEFGMEAALNEECLLSITNLFSDIGTADAKNDIKMMLNGLANIPQTALTMFYAGLLEHHRSGGEADGRVSNKEAAKELVVKYISEHKGEETGSFAGVMAMCFETMETDGFFQIVGLDGLFKDKNQAKKEEPEKKKKTKKKGLEISE